MCWHGFVNTSSTLIGAGQRRAALMYREVDDHRDDRDQNTDERVQLGALLRQDVGKPAEFGDLLLNCGRDCLGFPTLPLALADDPPELLEDVQGRERAREVRDRIFRKRKNPVG